MYLLWTALNAVAIIYFFAACIYAVQVIWQRLGVWPLLLLLLGLYSWGSSANELVAKKNTHPNKAVFATHLGVPTHSYVSIDNHYINEITLGTSYLEQPDTTVILNSQAYFIGFRLGNHWHSQLSNVTIKDK